MTTLTKPRGASPEPSQSRPAVARARRKRSVTKQYRLFTALGVLWLLVWFVLPILWILWDLLAGFERAMSFSESAAVVYLRVFRNTFVISLVVTAGSLVAGYLLAFFLWIVPRRLSYVLLFLVIVPYWVSIVIRTYGFIVAAGRNGIINSILMDAGLIEAPLQLMFRTGTVYVGMIQVLMPYVVLTVYNSLRAIDERLITAARAMGAPEVSVFRRIVFPLSLPGVWAGTLLVFIISIGFFVTPALLGSRRDMMLVQLIHLAVTERAEFATSTLLALPLLVTAFLLLAVFNRFLGLDRIWGGRD